MLLFFGGSCTLRIRFSGASRKSRLTRNTTTFDIQFYRLYGKNMTTDLCRWASETDETESQFNYKIL
jgi:hypothetical protein